MKKGKQTWEVSKLVRSIKKAVAYVLRRITRFNSEMRNRGNMRPLQLWNVFLSFVLASCAMCHAQTDPKNVPERVTTGAEQELRNAMAERHKAMLAGGTDTVERLTANDYVQTDISGYVQDKSAWLNEYFRPLAALIKAGKFRWDIYEEKDVQIHRFGDTAVVTGSMSLKGTGAKPSGHTWVESPETTFAGTLRFTRVWINRGGSWRLVALQNGLVKDAP